MRVVTACTFLVIVASAVGARRWHAAMIVAHPVAYAVPPLTHALRSAPDAAAAESTLISADMFRFAFDLTPSRDKVQTRSALPSASRSRPTLRVKAIVGGPPWQAIIDGIPGQPGGVVVQAGGVHGGVAIVDVGRDSVRVRVADTALTLFLRRSP